MSEPGSPRMPHFSDDAIRRLADEDPWGAAVVRMRQHLRLTREQIATALGVDTKQVDRRWSMARARLQELEE